MSSFRPRGTALEAAIRTRIDDVRTRHGLSRLRPDAALERAARAHSRAMAEHGFFAHESPLPGLADPADRVRAQGAAYQGVGENLALPSPAIATAERFVELWMASPGHRANLLTPAWTRTGVGIFGLRSGAPRWALHARLRIGAGYAVAAFAGGRLLAAAVADARGEAVLVAEAPPGGGRITFSRRHAAGGEPWIDLRAAEIEHQVAAAPGAPWLCLRGRTRDAAILGVDDRNVRRIDPGAFEIEQTPPPPARTASRSGSPSRPTATSSPIGSRPAPPPGA